MPVSLCACAVTKRIRYSPLFVKGGRYFQEYSTSFPQRRVQWRTGQVASLPDGKWAPLHSNSARLYAHHDFPDASRAKLAIQRSKKIRQDKKGAKLCEYNRKVDIVQCSQDGPPDNYIIFSDSLSALESMTSLNRFSHPLSFNILELHDRLTTKGFTILFCWIPSHVGISGNELADNLAKSVPNSLNSPVPVNDVNKYCLRFIRRIERTVLII
ncbi:hypothetical protein AVEN_93673-1 [Araneus ventricosus]|uniref:Uncharacterized protein n=1 Tax=Araneus ventricosus TaxID=182803 RepID=A0A4Y2TLS3_ARAVE|nr:hypothetical protein AVEN_93673-1 [Araneus ventricosus]